ncbi:MAG: prolyl oligopeptidase family serine peptidase, partial [Candidatus Obscuribacterales bacterium]|nr:prolyl oligopeptidase family serine peptidase [Candidatus Obscuribacterales bacterium]
MNRRKGLSLTLVAILAACTAYCPSEAQIIADSRTFLHPALQIFPVSTVASPGAKNLREFRVSEEFGLSEAKDDSPSPDNKRRFIADSNSVSKLAKKKIKMPEPVHVRGLPDIPVELANELSRYTNFRSATLAGWHPTEKEMLILCNLCQNTQVFRVKCPGGNRFQLTFEKDSVVFSSARARTASYDPQSGKFFVFSKDQGGTENNQTYRYDFDTGHITLLTDGTSRNTPGIWSNSGKHLAYESNRRNGRDLDLYLIDPREPESDRMLTQVGGGGWTILDWSPDDRKILVRKHRSIVESYIWQFDSQTGVAELLAPTSGAVEISYKNARYSQDGKGLFVLTDKDSEFLRLAYLELSTGKHTYLSLPIDWDVDKFNLTKDRSKIAYTTNENGVSVLHVYFIDTQVTKTFKQLPKGVVSAMEWHANGVELGFSFDSRKSPHDVYSMNVDSGEHCRWTESETGGINAENFDEPDLVDWISSDKLKFFGYVYRPPAKFTGKRPVIVYFHGGPEGQYRPTFIGRSNYFISELGIAMVFPNVRGSTGYGKTFLGLDDGLLRANCYEDMKATLDWIATQDDLDA